jgi:hypothetical protein
MALITAIIPVHSTALAIKQMANPLWISIDHRNRFPKSGDIGIDKYCASVSLSALDRARPEVTDTAVGE